MKGCSVFPKAPALLAIRLFSVISRTLIGGGVLSLCRGAVSVFYSPSRLDKLKFENIYIYIYIQGLPKNVYTLKIIVNIVFN